MTRGMPLAATPLTAAQLRLHPLRRLDNGADKELRGQVLVIGGSRTVPGAAVLTGLAALRAGAGKLKIATGRSLAVGVGLAVPESGIVALPETTEGEPRLGPTAYQSIADAAAIVVGPGLLASGKGAGLAQAVLKRPRRGTLVLDAGALQTVGTHRPSPRTSEPLILTPNYREMADLANVSLEKLEAAPLKIARDIAKFTHAIIVLKSDITHIVTPTGRAWVHDKGLPGLATSGSGDVLAGAIAGLYARCGDPVTACLWGVTAHARAGAALARRHGAVGYLAREMLDHLPRALT